MLIPFDDYPVHQTALPLAHAGDGHPDAMKERGLRSLVTAPG
ncbi:hypothetical protein [Pseudofrankia asymbiotica]|nr:hypothetical protein [Pseudofrankia asymbiotica]